jgi:hypothetical protein
MSFDPVGLKRHGGTSASPGTGYEIGGDYSSARSPRAASAALAYPAISASAATAIKITYEEVPPGEAAVSCSRLRTTRRPDARPV